MRQREKSRNKFAGFNNVPDDSVFFTPPNSQMERRLPLVGMSAVRVNRLDIRIDGDRSVFMLAAP